MITSNSGTSANQNLTDNEHRKQSLGAIFTLIASPDSEEIFAERGDRLRKCIKDVKQTTAQFAKDFIDQQYAFLYDICKQEAKYEPWYDVYITYNLQQLTLLCYNFSQFIWQDNQNNVFPDLLVYIFNLSFSCAAI